MRKSEARSEIIRLLHYGRQNLSLSAQQQDALEIAIDWLEMKGNENEQHKQPDPDTGLMPCGCGEWIYTIEKGSCMDYHVTAKCSECGWDWFSKDGVGNCSAVFGAFITNGDSKRDEAERFLIENAKANNNLNYCPNCGAKMEDKPCE